MRVAFLVEHLHSGGVERTVSYVAAHCAHHGIETTILSVSNEIFYTLDPAIQLITLDVPQGYKRIWEKYIRIAERIIKTRKAIKEGQYDVVFCMAPQVCKYILPLLKKKKFSLISSERNNPVYEEKKNIGIKEKVFSLCDGIVFQTKRARDWFPSDCMGIP